VSGNKVGELVVDIVQDLARSLSKLDPASAQYGDSVLILVSESSSARAWHIRAGARWHRRVPDAAIFEIA